MQHAYVVLLQQGVCVYGVAHVCEGYGGISPTILQNDVLTTRMLNTKTNPILNWFLLHVKSTLLLNNLYHTQSNETHETAYKSMQFHEVSSIALCIIIENVVGWIENYLSRKPDVILNFAPMAIYKIF